MSKSDKLNNPGAVASRLRSAQKGLDIERRFIDDPIQVQLLLLKQSRRSSVESVGEQQITTETFLRVEPRAGEIKACLRGKVSNSSHVVLV